MASLHYVDERGRDIAADGKADEQRGEAAARGAGGGGDGEDEPRRYGDIYTRDSWNWADDANYPRQPQDRGQDRRPSRNLDDLWAPAPPSPGAADPDDDGQHRHQHRHRDGDGASGTSSGAIAGRRGSHRGPGAPPAAPKLDRSELQEQVFSFCRHGRVKEVEAAVLQGFDPNTRDENGNTLLLLAAQNGLKKIAKKLLRMGAEINAQNAKGNSALHFCKAFGHEALLQYLLEKGAATLYNAEGLTYVDGIRRR